LIEAENDAEFNKKEKIFVQE